MEAEFRTQIQTHSALEPHGIVGDSTAEGGADGVGQHAGDGRVRATREDVGAAEGSPRVVTEYMGGGFGAKFGPQPGENAAAGLREGDASAPCATCRRGARST